MTRKDIFFKYFPYFLNFNCPSINFLNFLLLYFGLASPIRRTSAINTVILHLFESEMDDVNFKLFMELINI